MGFLIFIAVVSIIDDTLEKKKTNVSENINNSGVKDGVTFFSQKEENTCQSSEGNKTQEEMFQRHQQKYTFWVQSS